MQFEFTPIAIHAIRHSNRRLIKLKNILAGKSVNRIFNEMKISKIKLIGYSFSLKILELNFFNRILSIRCQLIFEKINFTNNESL